MDSFSLNFQNAGYDNNYLVPNLGFLFWVGFVILAFHVVNFLLIYFAKKYRMIEPLRRKLSVWLYWNGSFRYFIEGYMDLTLMALLNVKDLDWSGEHNAVTVSNVLALVITVLACTLPIFFVTFIALKLKSLNDEKF